RAAYVIARRDFVATVFRRTFLLFLLGPLFPVLLGFGYGGMGAKLAEDTARPTVAVIATSAAFEPLRLARERFAEAGSDAPPVELVRVSPEPDLPTQTRRLLAQKSPPVIAVLGGTLDKPTLTGTVSGDGRTAAQLRHLLDDARFAVKPSAAAPELTVVTEKRSGGTLATARGFTARAGQTIVFLLTILLAGAVLSQLIEEKSNKAIEILAAAVPVDAIFVGKLFAMLAISVVGIIVWTLVGSLAIATWTRGGLGGLPTPAVGWPAFILLSVLYFATAYLLIGAVFLAIGSQAASVREIQTLNMPVVLGQSMVYFFGAAAVGHLDEPKGLAAAIFPLSSPFAMIARAAEQPMLWPHLGALLWQALWVTLILRGGAKLFRRNVLKSGPQNRRWWRGRRASSEIILPNKP
ncbi:ABC transporter permease, partial [Sphingomonas sp.]|uniref:ABC transporter permease n=1 Tax=Sphingomonas sp. TaxID=28214 RepID=UPI00286D50B2